MLHPIEEIPLGGTVVEDRLHTVAGGQVVFAIVAAHVVAPELLLQSHIVCGAGSLVEEAK
jgi:hypothetical protein